MHQCNRCDGFCICDDNDVFDPNFDFYKRCTAPCRQHTHPEPDDDNMKPATSALTVDVRPYVKAVTNDARTLFTVLESLCVRPVAPSDPEALNAPEFEWEWMRPDGTWCRAATLEDACRDSRAATVLLFEYAGRMKVEREFFAQRVPQLEDEVKTLRDRPGVAAAISEVINADRIAARREAWEHGVPGKLQPFIEVAPNAGPESALKVDAEAVVKDYRLTDGNDIKLMSRMPDEYDFKTLQALQGWLQTVMEDKGVGLMTLVIEELNAAGILRDSITSVITNRYYKAMEHTTLFAVRIRGKKFGTADADTAT